MSLPSPAENAATVRRAIDYSAARTMTGTPEYRDHTRARDALAALLAQAEAAELKQADIDVALQNSRLLNILRDVEDERDAAVLLLGQIKDDREVLYRQWEAAVRERNELRDRLADASRERDQAREALRTIRRLCVEGHGDDLVTVTADAVLTGEAAE